MSRAKSLRCELDWHSIGYTHSPNETFKESQ